MIFLLSFIFLLYANTSFSSYVERNFVPKKMHSEYRKLRNFVETMFRNIRHNRFVVYIDPAHGKRKSDGVWSTEYNGRYSGSFGGKHIPEEVYSLAITRELYSILKGDKNIEIVVPKDYRLALEWKKDWYYDIPFTESLKLAYKNGAILFISEHLNNVGEYLRKDGWQVFGFFIKTFKDSKDYLVYNSGKYTRGAMVLFSYFDPMGIGKIVAKESISWLSLFSFPINSSPFFPDYRISVFSLHPATIFFETGFICNKDEEALLRNRFWIRKIAISHKFAIYKAIEFLKNLKNIEAYKGLVLLSIWVVKLSKEKKYRLACKLSRYILRRYKKFIYGKENEKRYKTFRKYVCRIAYNRRYRYRYSRFFAFRYVRKHKNTNSYKEKSPQKAKKQYKKKHKKKIIRKKYVVIIWDDNYKRHLRYFLGRYRKKLMRYVERKGVGIYVVDRRKKRIRRRVFVPIDEQYWINFHKFKEFLESKNLL